jgi:hypothetical protein
VVHLANRSSSSMGEGDAANAAAQRLIAITIFQPTLALTGFIDGL